MRLSRTTKAQVWCGEQSFLVCVCVCMRVRDRLSWWVEPRNFSQRDATLIREKQDPRNTAVRNKISIIHTLQLDPKTGYLQR